MLHCWGISTLGCPELNLPEAAALAQRFNFSLLELRTLSGSCELAARLRQPDNVACLRKLATEKRITLLGSGFGISNPAADLQELAELAEIADACRIPYIRIFGGMEQDQILRGTGGSVTAAGLRWKPTTATPPRPNVRNSFDSWANSCRWCGMSTTRSNSVGNRLKRASGC